MLPGDHEYAKNWSQLFGPAWEKAGGTIASNNPMSYNRSADFYSGVSRDAGREARTCCSSAALGAHRAGGQAGARARLQGRLPGDGPSQVRRDGQGQA